VELAAGHGGDGFGVEAADHAGADDSEFHMLCLKIVCASGVKRDRANFHRFKLLVSFLRSASQLLFSVRK